MNKKEEVWKDIPDYEGYYQASDLGRVRSLDRTVVDSRGRELFYRGMLIEGSVSSSGYKRTTLRGDGIGRNFKFSQIIAMTFLGHEPNGHKLVVDHINGDKSDDRVENLRIVTQRANISTCFRSNEESFSSQYVGVNWDKKLSKWKAQIYHDGVPTHLGLYDTELEASNAYQSALSKIKDGSFNHNDYRPKLASEYKGVSFYKRYNKWVAQITINGKNKHLGYFRTELEASNAYQEALSKIEDGSFNLDDYKPKFTSEYKGVNFHKASNKWRSRIVINGKQKHIGLFKTELEAHEAYLKAKKEHNLFTH